jgi:hypothetical protein
MEERQTIQRNGELWRTVRLPPVILAARKLAPAEKAKRSPEAKPGGQSECGGRSPEALGLKPEAGEQLAWLDAQHESLPRRERQRSPAQKKGQRPYR